MLEILINLFYSSQNSINTRRDKGKGKMIESPIDNTLRFGSLSEDPSDDIMDVEIITSDRYNLKFEIVYIISLTFRLFIKIINIILE